MSTEFFKKLRRPSFVTSKDGANEQRFNPTQTLFDLNTINHLTLGGKNALDIGKVADRDENLILKAGDPGRDLSIFVSPNYDPNKEAVLPQPFKPVLDFKRSNHRTLYRSIYRRENSPDCYDTEKLHLGFTRQSQVVQPSAMLDIGKQHRRDMSLFYRHNNEALKNIERDNMRQDFIKKLLSEEIVH